MLGARQQATLAATGAVPWTVPLSGLLAALALALRPPVRRAGA